MPLSMQAYAVSYTSPQGYSPTDLLTVTDDFLHVFDRSMDVTAKPFFDSEDPVRGCQIEVDPGGGCINTDNENYAVAIKGLKQPAVPLYQPLKLTITSWINDATLATAEPYNRNRQGRYQLDARGCTAGAAGGTFTLFRFDGYTSFLKLTGTGRYTVGAPPASLAALKTACTAAGAGCRKKTYTMGTTSNGLLNESALGLLDSSSVVYFVCVVGAA